MDGLIIFWTQTAIKQRDYIFEYWNDRNKSKSYSRKLNLAVKEKIELLKSQPKIGKQTNYKNTRALTMGHYSVLYKIDHHRIIITGFWDNRQDPKKLLDFIKKNRKRE